MDQLEAQFGPDGGAIWEALDLVVPADRYLNLGYSPGLWSHLVGSPQARLVAHVAETLSSHARLEPGDTVLDLGCGRGAPTAQLETVLATALVGVDRVAHNLQVARRTASGPAFVRGDARRLPLRTDSCAGAAAIDALVYVPDTRAVLCELERVLEPGGVAVVTDLLATAAVDPSARQLEQFASAWGFAQLETPESYRAAIAATDLSVRFEQELTPHSVGGFRRYTRAYLALADGLLRGPLARVGDRLEVDTEAVTTQVEVTHEALPMLRHRLLVLEA